MNSRALAETAFDVTYHGPALAEGLMPVRDLAPALLSLGDLFAEASVAMHPKRDPVALNIKAAPTKGSFIIDLILHGPAEAWNTTVDLFSSDPVEALNNIKELIIAPGAGLFWYIKSKRNRKVAHREDAPESGQVRLTLDDGTLLEVPADVLALHGNVEVRRQAHRVIEPLNRPGVEAVEFRAEEQATLRVEKDDVPVFEAEGVEETVLMERELEMVVSITAPVFIPGNKWRLSDGQQSFHATIEDEPFLERVDQGIEFFRAGDMLRCRMRLVQSQREGSLHTEYVVAEVYEHIPRVPQLPLEGS